MDFLAKHYEKLILAGSLICLIVCVLLASNGVQSSNASLAEKEAQAKRDVQSLSKELGDIDVSVFDGPTALVNPYRLVAVEDVNRKKGGLAAPKRYVICKNKECGHFLSFNSDRCPFCGAVQEVIGKETTPEDDTDEDGIPDVFEQRHRDVLDFLDPDDSRIDSDGDGFLNLEEYKAGTDLEDPLSHPELANLVRLIGKPFFASMPIVFERLRKADSENQDDWRLEFTLTTRYGREAKTAKLGEEVGAYRVVSVEPEEGLYATVEEIATGKQFQLSRHKPLNEEQQTVRLIYLVFRSRYDIRSNPMMSVRVGEKFDLPDPGDYNGLKSESYKVLPIGEDGSVKVVQWDANQDESMGIEVDLREISKDDFQSEPQMNMGVGAGMGGAVPQPRARLPR